MRDQLGGQRTHRKTQFRDFNRSCQWCFIENVAKMFGHSNTNMTRHYARVLDKSIKRDMALVNSKFSEQSIATGQ